MEWIVESYDRKTDRDGESRFATESAFMSAAEELLQNMGRRFVSATLPKPGLGFGREAGLQRADAIDDALEAERPEEAWLH